MSAPWTTLEQLDEFMTRPSERVNAAVAQLPGDFGVLGAGGKMGYHVSLMLKRALEAVGRRERLTVVSRFGSQEAREPFDRAGFHVLSADMTDEKQVAALPHAKNVIYLAGVKFGTSNSPELLQLMNVHMPQLVAEHFHDSRIAALSTGCVYSFVAPDSGGSTETSETKPVGDYAISCLGREDAFIAGSKKYGTKCALIRLNYAIDMRYGVLLDIAQKVYSGRPVDVTTGHVNVIWQGDAVAHTIQSLAYATSPPLILNVTGPETLSVRELAERFAKRFNRPAQIEGIEAETALLSNATKSHQLLGAPRISIDQMIDWTADWLQRGGKTLEKPTHFEARDGKY